MTTIPADRIFRDTGLEHFAHKVLESAAKYGYSVPVMVEQKCKGPTGKPYLMRCLGNVEEGRVVRVCRVNRRGACIWRFEIGGESWRPVSGN